MGTAHRMLSDLLLDAGQRYYADPGDAGTINPYDRDFAICRLVTTGAETRTLADPVADGQRLTLVMQTDGGDCVVTASSAVNDNSDTVITFNDVGDMLELRGVHDGASTFAWRVVGYEGVTGLTETIPAATITTGTVTTLTSTTATVQTMSRPAVLTAEHGVGAIGTAFAPRTYRYTREGTIITEIHVDLTGLACKGDAAKDAIGLAAGGAAYIGRYVVATNGVVYRVEMSCLEAPGEGTATITSDIDLGAEDAADTAYDGAVDDVVIDTGGLAAGKTYVNDAPALTANDYLYLVEGDTAASTGVYNAGQVIVRLFGHAVLS